MKNRIKSLLATSAAMGALVCAMTVNATPIRLDVAAPLEPANSGDGVVKAWVQTLVNNYNAANNPDLPTPVGPTALQATNNGVDPDGAGPFPGYGANTGSITLPMGGYEYLALRWGGPQADKWQAYYIGGSTGTFQFNAPGTQDQGLSDYRLYNPHTTVPDGGMTLALLSFGLVVAGSLRRVIA